MNSRSLIVIAVGYLALAAPSVHAQGKGGWIGSLAEGKNQAAKSGKPMMIVFRCEP